MFVNPATEKTTKPVCTRTAGLHRYPPEQSEVDNPRSVQHRKEEEQAEDIAGAEAGSFRTEEPERALAIEV